MGVEYNQPAHLLDRYIKGVILTVVDCKYKVINDNKTTLKLMIMQ